MPTYIYETIPQDSGTEPRRFEMVRRMTNNPLKFDPETGEPVRQIITGGLGINKKVLRRSTVVNKSSAAATACGCASGKSHRATAKGRTGGCGHNH